MSRPRLAIASGNGAGCRAAVEVARAGGNAVDACLASAVAAWVAEPFFASMGGSGFVAVRGTDGVVEVFDGNNVMPLRIAEASGTKQRRVYLDYSNGMYTGIGGASVAVPGVLAAVRLAWERHGSIEWPALFAGAIAAARDGIAFPHTSAYYLSITWEPIWSAFAPARRLLGGVEPLAEGDELVQPELAEALDMVAARGPEVFYAGSLGTEIIAAISADGGLMSLEDLVTYSAERRVPVTTEAFGWRIDSNPPPAMGGALLTMMLALLDGTNLEDPEERLRSIVEAERTAIGYRNERYNEPDDVAAAAEQGDRHGGQKRSSATTHTSAADEDGLVCSITESNGYGAGLVVHGVMLNNTLGEEELNPVGARGLPAGARCHSNMAPTIATRDERAVGLGSPGADRIVGAVAQTILRLALDGLSLREAVAAPRAHLAPRPEGHLLCFEPGLPGGDLGYRSRPYDEPHMFFGAVQAASATSDGTVDAAHDPRRSGASALV
ncbi:MAG: gamma-glutamyltransferase [Actinomycetota bacterium]